MRDIRTALRTHLLSDAQIAAAVVARVYPVVLPQGQKLASIVYTRISGLTDYKMEGPSGYARSRMQIGCWAPTLDAASSLANLVKDALSGFAGPMGTTTPAVVVQGIFCEDEREQWDDIAEMYGVSRDYFIHHEER